MKIGILTLPLHTNYGGILQAYALQTVLERMGHEVEVIRLPRVQSKIDKNTAIVLVKRIIKKYVLRKPTYIFAEKKTNMLYPVLTQYTGAFIAKYIHSHDFGTYGDIASTTFDALVVGSDQVWRSLYTNKYAGGIRNFFFLFAEKWNIRRLAYAASFGTDEWEYTEEETTDCKRLLSLFNNVSVREHEGVSLCEKKLATKATQVLDPTMLLTKADYVSLIGNTPQSKGTLFNYILDETPFKTEMTNYLAERKGLKPFRVNAQNLSPQYNIKDCIQQPVESWLKAFADAEFIVTDSFHACVFSIIFNKQFVVIGNKERGVSRFKSLLSLFNLENRLVTSIAEEKNLKSIDFNDVNLKLQEERQKSNSFLQGALNF